MLSSRLSSAPARIRKPSALSDQGATGLQKKDFVNSVDEVERITGYDFFSKLPDNIEKKIEAKADINQW